MNNISDQNLNDIIVGEYNISKMSDDEITKQNKKLLIELSSKLEKVDKFIDEYEKRKEQEKEFCEYWTKEFEKINQLLKK